MRNLEIFYGGLRTIEFRKEIIPYLYDMIQDILSDNMLKNSSLIIAHKPDKQNVEDYIRSTIIDSEDKGLLENLINTVNFILFNPHNPDFLNPYDPKAGGLKDAFFAKDIFFPEIALELWDYSQREIIKNSLQEFSIEPPTKKGYRLGIQGITTAGKTTFVKGTSIILCLKNANLTPVFVEPEDSEKLYPEQEYSHHLQYSRVSTRGNEATQGRESMLLFIDLPSQGLINLQLYSSGGHLRAKRLPGFDHPNTVKYGSMTFFIDYRLMKEISLTDLDNIGLKTELSNNESVQENLLSLIHQYRVFTEYVAQTGVPVNGVISKLPLETKLCQEVLIMVEDTYQNPHEIVYEF